MSSNKFHVLFFLYLKLYLFNCKRLMIIEHGRYLNSTYFYKEIKSSPSVTHCALKCNISPSCYSLNVFRGNPLICQFFASIIGDFVYHEDASYIRYFDNSKYQKLSTQQEKGTSEATYKATATTALTIPPSTESFTNTVQQVTTSIPSLSPGTFIKVIIILFSMIYLVFQISVELILIIF